MHDQAVARTNRIDAFWQPFTPMRQYREAPRILTGAEGMYYVDRDGRQILDGMGGLWCVNAGHGRVEITRAVQAMAGRLDFVSSFGMSHDLSAQTAAMLCEMAPAHLDHAFFVNSGSEAVDTALKIARAYHFAQGRGERHKFIGRAKGYHGMGFGGLSVAGIGKHKRQFGPLLADVAHLPLPYDESMRFGAASMDAGSSYAEALTQLLTIHDPSTVAAVIVEPVTGSGGVFPPPQGYLERLREICDVHGILLIFDEVVTGFGRMGEAFAAQHFGVTPDLITCAKGLTNGAVPMGAVLVRDDIYAAFMDNAPAGIELSHGYTYSAHPLACAAAVATMTVHKEDRLSVRAAGLRPQWTEAAMGLNGLPNVIDIRTAGILAAIDIAPNPESPGSRGRTVADYCYEQGVLVRNSGDAIVLSPPLVISADEIGRIFATLADGLRAAP